MRELNINPNWNFKELVGNLKALRSEYDGILCFFSYYDLHEKVLFQAKIKQLIYSYPFEEWKKDRVWEYMNHDIFFCILRNIAGR